MAEAGTDTKCSRVANGFKSARNFRRNGHHLDVAIAGLPELVEELRRRLHQIFRWMHPTLSMADEGTFQVNAQRHGAIALFPVFLRGLPQMLEGMQQAIFRSSDRCG